LAYNEGNTRNLFTVICISPIKLLNTFLSSFCNKSKKSTCFFQKTFYNINCNVMSNTVNTPSTHIMILGR